MKTRDLRSFDFYFLSFAAVFTQEVVDGRMAYRFKDLKTGQEGLIYERKIYGFKNFPGYIIEDGHVKDGAEVHLMYELNSCSLMVDAPYYRKHGGLGTSARKPSEVKKSLRRSLTRKHN